jgi:hypothetical protein
MKWSKIGISFGPKDHREKEPYNQNLPFVVKLPIKCHKVANTIIDNGASLNLVMNKTFIKIGLNLLDLAPVHDTFHSVIPGHLSTPIALLAPCRPDTPPPYKLKAKARSRACDNVLPHVP